MPRLKRIFRIMRYGVTALLVVVLLGAVWGWWRWNTQPSYWHVTEAGQPNAAEEAERFEFWVGAQATAVREGDGRWTMRIETQQINQWLAEQSKKWAVNQGIEYPDWLENPMVALERGRIVVAGHVRRDEFDNIMSLVYEPRVNEAGVVVLELKDIRVGSLGIAAGLVLDKVLKGYRPGEVEKIRRNIQHVQMRSKVDGGRIVSVERMQIDAASGVVMLDCRTAHK